MSYCMAVPIHYVRQTPPPEWTTYVSTGGRLYFHHKAKVRDATCKYAIYNLSYVQSLVTMTNLYNVKHLKEIETAADQLLGPLAIFQANSSVPADIEINLCKIWQESDGELVEVIAYYLASLSEECVYWLEKVDSNMVTGWERSVLSKSHLRGYPHSSHHDFY